MVKIDRLKASEENALSTGPFGSAISSKYFLSEGIPVIRGSNLSENIGERLVEDDFAFLSSSKANEFSRSIVRNGDIVFTCWGTVGQVGIFTEKSRYPQYVISNKQMKLTPNSEVADSLFLYYLFSGPAFVDQVKGSAIGSSVPGFNLTQLRSLEILLPPLPEQRAIAAVLSSLDDKIDLLRRQNKTLEAMAETLFRQWFVEEADEEWEEVPLGKHVVAFRGLSYQGSGLTDIGLGLPMHNLNSIHEGSGYKFEGIKFYSGEHKERHLISPGELIVANTEQGHEFRLIGFPAIVPDTFGNTGLFSQHIYKLVPREETYLSIPFIYYLLITPRIREQITSATNGSTVNMLAIDGLQRPIFRLPAKELIVRFTALIDQYWKKQSVNERQIRTLEKLRDTLLPKLMSGEVRVEIGTHGEARGAQSGGQDGT